MAPYNPKPCAACGHPRAVHAMNMRTFQLTGPCRMSGCDSCDAYAKEPGAMTPRALPLSPLGGVREDQRTARRPHSTSDSAGAPSDWARSR